MKMKKYILVINILLSLIMLNCADKDNSIKKIQLKAELDFLLVDSSKIFLQTANEFVLYKDSLVFVDGKDKKIYVTDWNFVIHHTIDLAGKEYLFKSTIYNVSIRNNLLYLMDNSEKIKVVDLKKEDISYIDYEISFDVMMSYPGNFEFIDDSTFICASESIWMYPAFDTVNVAAKFNVNGKRLNLFAIPIDKLGYNSYYLNSNQSPESFFVTYNDSRIYVTCYASKKILIYNTNGTLLGIKDLDVNSEYWEEPQAGGAPVPGVNSIKISPVTMHKVVFVNNCAYLLQRRGTELPPLLIEYDTNFVKTTEYEIDNNNVTSWQFRLYYANNKIILQDVMSPTLFIMDEIN
ncbi:MAG: hypothetical protein K9J16_07640 [Melioribacteraceae bacterium]|nr:hypothetical protein [Melioribacteraceae bacterium]MCF8357030.1 hypothetical protein [Melioribacteraceae bacterium]MCF8393954.1 hypothetical protein [Melioribacteraceae bacterium]MCF8419027.1 hypothetical protein [Melioribacteraceae bacterium]